MNKKYNIVFGIGGAENICLNWRQNIHQKRKRSKLLVITTLENWQISTAISTKITYFLSKYLWKCVNLPRFKQLYYQNVFIQRKYRNLSPKKNAEILQICHKSVHAPAGPNNNILIAWWMEFTVLFLPLHSEVTSKYTWKTTKSSWLLNELMKTKLSNVWICISK